MDGGVAGEEIAGYRRRRQRLHIGILHSRAVEHTLIHRLHTLPYQYSCQFVTVGKGITANGRHIVGNLNGLKPRTGKRVGADGLKRLRQADFYQLAKVLEGIVSYGIGTGLVQVDGQ